MTITAEEEKEDEEHLKNTGTEDGDVSNLGTSFYCNAILQFPLEYYRIWVVVSNIIYFQPYLGKIPILTNIFQMGWNHQLGMLMF